MFLLGIVGTPASGKSTVSQWLSEWGAEWINADLVARECLNTPDVIDQLVDRFGENLVNDDGTVNRVRLADWVFGSNPEQVANLRYLESLVHPKTRTAITQRIREAAKKQKQVALLDVQLLFESSWDLCCDSIWCIDAARKNRLRWCEKRGWDPAELDRREAHQLPIESKYRLSQFVMRNDSTLDGLLQIVRRHWDQLVRIELVDESDSTRGHCHSDWPL